MYEQLKKKKEEKVQNPEVNILHQEFDKLVHTIESTLFAVAMRLRTVNVLSVDQYETICDLDKYHTHKCMDMILKQIGEEIKRDEDKLRIFNERVIGDMGVFYDDLVNVLSKGLNEEQMYTATLLTVVIKI